MQCATCDHDHDGMSPCWREECGCPTFDGGNDGCCSVPAWHFRLDER